MTDDTTIALVTGANKGLGRETVRRLADLGWTVLLGSRDADRGAATAGEIGGDVCAVAIDVTDDGSVAAAGKEIEERWGRLDVLVNNAGILGSLAITSDPDRLESTIVSLTYPSSKAALNMITTQYAKALPRFRVTVADPGYTATDLNGNSGPQTVTEGTDAIVGLATAAPDGPTGTYVDRAGALPW